VMAVFIDDLVGQFLADIDMIGANKNQEEVLREIRRVHAAGRSQGLREAAHICSSLAESTSNSSRDCARLIRKELK